MKKCDTCRFQNEDEYHKPCIVYRDDCELYEKKEMTRAEAIRHLEDILCENKTVNHSDMVIFEQEKEALRIAINSLKVDEMYDLYMEKAERLITREDVIYAIAVCGCLYHQGKTWYEEEELIRCFDDLYFNDSKEESK